MLRPVTLFTGQWADLELEGVAEFANQAGFEGLELACWGEHLDVVRCLNDAAYRNRVNDLLERYSLSCWALGAHLIGQATCDRIDSRHRAIVPPEIWGDGDPAGVRQRAADRMKDTARAAACLGVRQVNGFTGSPVWPLIYSFPPNDFSEIEHGYEQFAEIWSPILDVFEREGVRFGLEVHPTEIAYDFVTTRKSLDALDRRENFGLNLDPSHLVHQSLDPARFAEEFSDRIYHVHVKDVKVRLNGERSILGSHLDFGDPRRGWDFVSLGRGDVDFDALLRALDRIDYAGPLSVEWEDAGMDRKHGAREALAYMRRIQFPSTDRAFDAAMQRPRDTRRPNDTHAPS
ncbi:sugar phosphate isomerase/epimerase [Conexibacter sp. S30A1]|jgi:sugar phosphate isomerase/epimerase|uniref:sugar phosphate isomerase/epimerase family protein n=1 Tax=Conexibacter sp. S30A1 TaxID=2937800 RepID=UPI00200C2E69|nr:sugar phosphate isomerase/epimerase family protein [Conexibacter sp. S30A1]